jgi:hypothetical protein
MPQRAVEHLTMTQASSAPPFQEQSIPQQSPLGFIAGGMPSGTSEQQMVSLSQRVGFSTNCQIINPLQRLIQAQDPSQGQRQESDCGLGSHTSPGQNLDSSGMGLSQGLQQNFNQPSPSFPQPSSATSAAQPQPGAQQVSGPGSNLSAMSLPQLRQLSSQLLRIVMETEKNLPAAGSYGENDIQRQLRLKVENNKRYLRMLQELISARTRAR